MDQSYAGSTGMFSRWTNHTRTYAPPRAAPPQPGTRTSLSVATAMGFAGSWESTEHEAGSCRSARETYTDAPFPEAFSRISRPARFDLRKRPFCRTGRYAEETRGRL
eukprot:339290-Prorocentrum_minimum.AAC.2